MVGEAIPVLGLLGDLEPSTPAAVRNETPKRAISSPDLGVKPDSA
jgi:hypothetical protein